LLLQITHFYWYNATNGEKNKAKEGRQMDDLDFFGVRMREARNDKDLTVRELGEILGVSGATISRYETGEVDPKRTFIAQTALVLGVDPAWLMGANVDKYTAKPIPCKKIPIVGMIAAGNPIFAHENIEGYEWICDDDNVHFCLIVKGDSMTGARVFNGDVVFVRQQDDVNSGEIAVVLVDDEATLKRVYKIDGSIILHSENPSYPDMIFSRKDAKVIRVLGKAVAFKGVLR
jgi:repressor LexA